MSAANQPSRGGRVSSEARPGWVPVAQIAGLLMLTPQRLRDLARAGAIPAAEHGRYAMVGTVQGYIRFLKDEERRSSKVQAENSLKAARQREIELRIAREDHRLIETEEAVAVLDEVLGTFRAEIGGVAAAVTRDLELRRQITAAIDGVFARTSTKLAERAASLRTTGTASALLPVDEDV